MMLDGWQDLSLSDLATIVGGGTPSRRQPTYWDGDVPWATPTDVTGLGGRIISETASMITGEGLANSSAALLPPCSLLMTTRATIGACAINQVSMATNQGFQSLVPKRSTCVEFLYYLIQHHKRRLERLAAGSTFQEVSKRSIRGFRVAVPPLPEQRKIATVLSSVDDAIEKTRVVIDQVRVVKRGLMQESFTPDLPTGIGPSEWIEVCLGDLFTLQLGKMLNRKARETLPRFPYLGNKDVHWGRFDFSSLREMHFNDRERDRYRLLPGDLLVCEGGEVGRTAIWSGGFDCYYQKAIHRLRVRDSAIVEPRFIMHFMRFAAANRMFSDLTSQSSIAHLTREKLLLLKVPLPSLPEQRKIAAILSSVDDTIEENQTVMGRLLIVKRALMSTLLTGELRVTPDPEVA